jgi:hypothetical protein
MLHTLCAELQRQKCTAVVVGYSDCGDTDLRLQVTRQGAPIVELLGPYNGLCDDACWHAVRIDTDDRSIWCGPPASCRDRPLIEFVLDLLAEPLEALSRRYRAL